MLLRSLKLVLGVLYVLWCQQPQQAPPPSQTPAQNPAQPTPPPKKKEPKPQVPREPAITARVVLISIPALGADFLAHAIEKGARVPNLEKCRREGASARMLEGVYPSLTLPSHATILSGMLPADHKITSDHPFDVTSASTLESTGWGLSDVKTSTILDAVSSAGMAISSRAFPLLGDSGAATAVNTGLELYYLADIAGAASKFGVESREAVAALEEVDSRLGQVLAGLSGKATVLIVTDAGREAVEREFRPNVILARNKFLSAGHDGRIEQWRAVCQAFGGSAGVRLADPRDEKLIAELVKVFTEASEKPQSPVWRVVDKQSAARLGADPAFAFFLDAAPHYVMSERAAGDPEAGTKLRGSAGYLPQRSALRGVLIASGLGVKAGARLEYARLVDIAPTIARMLGLELRVTRGRVLSEVINQ